MYFSSRCKDPLNCVHVPLPHFVHVPPLKKKIQRAAVVVEEEEAEAADERARL